MFGLKLFRRKGQQSPAPQLGPPPAHAQHPGVSRLSGPPPPPPPGAFASFQMPAATASVPSFTSPTSQPAAETGSFARPAAFAPSEAFEPPDVFLPAEVVAAPQTFPGEASSVDPGPEPQTAGDTGAPARVRFFYEDGSVSEADAEDSERLGYLANNLLEASRDDLA